MMRERGNRMAESERIKNAFVNVITLAKNSIEYGKARDDQDIDLIESIVKKEIPRSPIRNGYWYDPDRSRVHVGWKCSDCGTKYRVYYADYDYCPHCGQRLDWSEL